MGDARDAAGDALWRATFLGTGTSGGVPIIGCDCPVCRSPDPRNRRLRSSLYVEAVLVDTPPDFREQALRYRLPRVDAVLFTHAHADHVMGFDDIRRFNTMQHGVIPAYGAPETMADVRRIFSYIGTERVPGFYRPQIEFHVRTAPFTIGGLRVTPLSVWHGPDPVHGYRFDAGGRSLAYVPDCSGMPDEAIEAVQGVDVMVLDALRHRPHLTHLTVEQSVDLLRRIGARQSWLVHMCHDLDHEATEAALPAGVRLSYDGLVVEPGA